MNTDSSAVETLDCQELVMLKHAGELARELFQDTLSEPPPSRVVERRLEAIVPIREH